MQTQRVLDEFRNEPFTDFSKPENAEAMKAALEKVKSELGREYPVVINGEKISIDSKFQSYNPANKTEVVGVFSEVDDEIGLVEKAIDSAWEAFKTWRNVAPVERAEYLFKVADAMRRRKHELSAWMVYEVAKPSYRPIRPKRVEVAPLVERLLGGASEPARETRQTCPAIASPTDDDRNWFDRLFD